MTSPVGERPLGRVTLSTPPVSRARRWLSAPGEVWEDRALLGVMLLIGGMAGAAAWTTVAEVSTAHGHGGWRAWANSAIVELLSIAAGLDIRRRRRGRRGHVWPTVAVLVSAVVLSLGAQLVAAGLIPADLGVIGWIVAALPALGFLVMVKMALGRLPVTVTAAPIVEVSTPIVAAPVTLPVVVTAPRPPVVSPVRPPVVTQAVDSPPVVAELVTETVDSPVVDTTDVDSVRDTVGPDSAVTAVVDSAVDTAADSDTVPVDTAAALLGVSARTVRRRLGQTPDHPDYLPGVGSPVRVVRAAVERAALVSAGG